MRSIAPAARAPAAWIKNVVTMAAVTALLILPASLALAQAPPVMRKGDAAVTSFSGALAPATPPAGMHPLDATFIDTSKPTLQVFDLSKLGGPPSAQLANAPVRFEAKAADIGHVFAVAVDNPLAPAAPDLYAGATSMFGLQIVEPSADGKLTRLVKGSARAQWMPGQFGLEKGGGPGSIWKIDGASGTVSLFSNVTSGNVENAGPGIGGVAVDTLTGHVFATNLETGLIHRLDMAGRELDTFDHGVTARGQLGLPAVADDPAKRMDIKNPAFNIEDPATWGYANSKRRVVAVTVANGRLYYSVAEGPVIWSAGLNADSSIVDDARLEIDVTNSPNGNPVTGIVFDGAGTMYISQRGESTGSYDYSTFARPQLSVVSRYTFDDKVKEWKEAPQEVAIGLEPVHRATNGGIALNYGYDSNGTIDTSKCRQTLWTTGEHLRAGSSEQAIVHGLQGNDKNQVQVPSASPARSGSTALQGDFAGKVPDAGLTPPKDVWFTDKDGQFNDANAHAHIGAVAIFNPCDQVASAPRPSVPPYVPGTPRPRPGIYIDKICAPALFGANTLCEVSVTNVGVTPLWPISFTDAGSVLTGPGAGTPLLVESVTPDGPDFFCSAAPSTAISCALPAASLPPGATRKVSLLVDTDPIFSVGNDGFENCATLDIPHSGKACFRSKGGPSGGGIVLKKTAPASCPQNGPCTYSLTATNTSGLPFNGPVLISDEMLINGTAPSPSPVTSIVPPMGCTGGEPAALPIQCTTALILAPGGSKSFAVTITMPPGDFWAHNCFAVTSPSSPPPGALSAVGSCAWTKVGNPAPIANLKVNKTAGACGKTGPDTVRCNYAISLTNTGPTPFNAPVSLTETVSATATMGSLDAAWQCPGAAPNFTCNSAANVTLAAGASTSFPVFVDTPRVDIEANACLAPNKVSVLAPVGGVTNFDASDDTASTLADSALLEFFDPITGLTTVICDPTNLRTTKVATGDCTKAGAGYECGYKVTITNMGPDPYKGPVNLKDEIAGATTVSATGDGWACVGGGATLQCSKPPLTLAKGASLDLAVTAMVPETGQCAARNRATMTFPLAGTRFNLSGADDSATAASVIPSLKCLEKPTCTQPGPGEFSTASGACACAQGSTRDRNLRCIAGVATVTSTPPAADTCPDGYPIPQNGICPCLTGAVWNTDKRACDAPCDPGRNEYRTSAGQCVCKTGYIAARDGAGCVVSEEDEPRPTQPPVRPPVIEDLCDPGPNAYRTPGGRCVCKEGYERSGSRCVAERDEPRCAPGPNEYRTSKGNCVCKQGYERDTRGRCVAEEWDCPANKVFSNRLRKCVEVDQPIPARECPNGYYGNYPNCKLIKDPGPSDAEKCKNRGGRYIEGDCVFKEREPKGCGPGFYSDNGKCRRNECPDGYDGSYPNCYKPQRKECPNGYVGQYPNCKAVPPPPPKQTEQCPEGTKGYYPFCKKIKQKCPNGTYGQYPNCKAINDIPAPQKQCPKGTFGSYPNCKVISDTEKPKPKPQVPLTDTQQFKPQKPAPKPNLQLNNKQLQKAAPNKSPLLNLEPKPCPPGYIGTPPKCAQAAN